MCPHALLRIELELKSASYAEVSSALDVFSSPKMPMDSLWVTYCKVCGGYLYRSTGLEVNIGNITQESVGEFMTLIRAETFSVTNFLTFETSLTPSSIANLAVKYVLPFTNNADAEFLKISRKKIPEKMKMTIFIVIVTYSFLLFLLLLDDYKDQVHIKGKHIQGAKRNKEYTSFIFGRLMASLKKKEINLASEYVMSKLDVYYATLRKFVQTKKLTFTVSKDEFLQHITTVDPVYDYVRMMYLLYNKLPIGKNTDTASLRKEFESILGAPPASLEKKYKDNSNIYASIYRPKETQHDTDQRVQFLQYTSGITNVDDLVRTWLGGGNALEIPLKLRLHVGGAKPPKKSVVPIKTPNLKDLYEGYLKESYDLYHEYVTKVANNVSNPDVMTAYSQKLKKLRTAESHLRMTRISTKLITNLNLSIGRIQRLNLSLNEVYDEDGRKHVWSIFVYDKGEHTKQDIVKDVDLRTSQYKDLRCSVCGILKSEVSTLDGAKVKDTLESKAAVAKLITFYSSRCPEGGLHAFDKESRCTKCGFSEAADASTRYKYFKKYAQTFEKDQALESATKLQVMKQQAERVKKVDYKYNHSFVITLADLYKVPTQTFERIGAFEQKDYNEVLSDKQKVDPVADETDFRNYALEAAIRSIFTNYNIIKYNVRVLSTPPYVQTIIADFPTEHIPQLPKLLPDISSEFRDLYPSVKLYYDADTRHLFLIESLAKMLVSILKAKYGDGDVSAKVAGLMKRFVDAEVNRIIETEKFTSKRNIMDLELADDFEEIVVNDKKFDPFSYDNIDYDGTNDTNS
jgi:hypothetical protein